MTIDQNVCRSTSKCLRPDITIIHQQCTWFSVQCTHIYDSEPFSKVIEIDSITSYANCTHTHMQTHNTTTVLLITISSWAVWPMSIQLLSDTHYVCLYKFNSYDIHQSVFSLTLIHRRQYINLNIDFRRKLVFSVLFISQKHFLPSMICQIILIINWLEFFRVFF